MVIDPKDAKEFIKGYTAVMAQVHFLTEGGPDVQILPMLASSRQKVVEDPPLLEIAIGTLQDLEKAPSDEVLAAIRSLQVKDWIFLRDTTRYSIFLEPDAREAYAVLGLTNPINKIIGSTGAAIRTGVMRYKEKYVCDGVVTNLVVLGPGYLESFSERFKELKRSGHFHIG